MKIYRIIPIIGYLVELIKNEKHVLESPVFQLYHITTGTFIGLILTLLFINNY